MRTISMLLGAAAFVTDIMRCAVLGKEPAWVERVRGITQPPHMDASRTWRGIDGAHQQRDLRRGVMSASVHPLQSSARAHSCPQHSATAQASSERVAGCQPPQARAKHLRLSHANPVLQLRRERVAVMLGEVFGDVKQIAIAAEFGVSRALAMRWMDIEAVDKNPAPLALLIALDEESFERVVEALRAERAAERAR
jgi:hypothetical protein